MNRMLVLGAKTLFSLGPCTLCIAQCTFNAHFQEKICLSENGEIIRMTFTSRNVMAVPASPPHNITTIEWEMLDKRRFYPLSMMSRSPWTDGS